jgi:hypothetical protein
MPDLQKHFPVILYLIFFGDVFLFCMLKDATVGEHEMATGCH